ncbi:MAG: sulfotransferase family protein [Planctomycetota bacterium]|jgi:hypothetical protein
MLAQPVFIVGSERSGTTLLRLTLNMHPRIGMHEEFEFSVDQLPGVPEGAWPDLNEYYDYLSLHRIFNYCGFDLDTSLDYPRLVDDFLRQKTDPEHHDVVGATVHFDFDQVQRIWPDARFIHIVRDGRDVSLSVYRKGWVGNYYTATDRWIEAETTWERFAPTLKPDQHISVYYEQLVRDTEETLSRICRFVGLEFHPDMLEYSRVSTYEPVNVNFLDQWRRKLSPQQVRYMEARIAPILQKHNYPLSGHTPLRVGPLRHAWLLFHDHAAKLSRRAKQFGLALTLVSYFARKLHIKPLQRRLWLRFNTLENQNLAPHPVPETGPGKSSANA